MFSVKLDQMIDDCGQLGKQNNEYGQLIVELETAINSLSSLSYMDDIIMRLKTQKSAMDGQHMIMRQMTQALDKTAGIYISCENKICDNGEQSVVHFVRKEVVSTSLKNIYDVLQETILIS